MAESSELTSFTRVGLCTLPSLDAPILSPHIRALPFPLTSSYIYMRRQNLPGYWAPFTLMALSGLPHAPWSVALHCTIGVDEATRDFLRTMDVFFIVTCAGAGQRASAG